MSMNYKKHFKMRSTYVPKDIFKHKHNYVELYVLEITNKNIHASACYYNKKEYHYVLKCDQCDSFIPKSVEGNYDGHIFDDNYDKELPLIKACTNMKCPVYDFINLYDVTVESDIKSVK